MSIKNYLFSFVLNIYSLLYDKSNFGIKNNEAETERYLNLGIISLILDMDSLKLYDYYVKN